MIHYVIPARKGSGGFPFKNRKLFYDTYDRVRDFKNLTIITDDDWFLDKHSNIFWYKMNDTCYMRKVLMDFAKEKNLKKEDIIVMLYLTYPQRKALDIQNALFYFTMMNAKSLLCRKEIKTHPYLCLYENKKQIVKHDLYRRQDYPKVFEISHFISIMQVDELKKLNKNLYNKKTVFMPIQDVIDVDYEKDYKNV